MNVLSLVMTILLKPGTIKRIFVASVQLRFDIKLAAKPEIITVVDDKPDVTYPQRPGFPIRDQFGCKSQQCCPGMIRMKTKKILE
jgi:hypothetical protein